MFWYGLMFLFVLLRGLIPLAMLLLVAWLVVRALKRKGPGGFRHEEPLKVLKVRYARGEISREEYDRMREELKTWALESGAAAEDIIGFCRERIARFKVPKAVEFGELPKTSTGKIMKYVLRNKEWARREKKVN